MRLLSRTVFEELCGNFLLGGAALLSLILVGRVLQLRELFISLALTPWDLARLFAYLSPFFLLLIVPIACMLSVFLTFLRMSTDRELTAVKASGVSLYKLMPPVALFCVLCTGMTLAVSLHGLGWGMERFRAEIMELARTKTQLVIQPGVFNTDFPGLAVYAKQVDAEAGVLRTVIVQDQTKEGITATFLAPRGQVVTDSRLGRILFLLQNGHIYRQEGDKVSVLAFEDYAVRLDLAKLLKGFSLGEMQPKEMDWGRLQTLAADPDLAAREGENFARKVDLERHKRFVLPLACLVLGLMAVPLACAFEGLSRQLGVVFALGFFLVYYSVVSLGLSLGETGAVPPAWGLWPANAVFLLAGLYGVRLAARERFVRLGHGLGQGASALWRRLVPAKETGEGPCAS